MSSSANTLAMDHKNTDAHELGSYFPTLPPDPPLRSTSYPRALEDAPRSALVGVLVHNDDPRRHPVSKRHRDRRLVGATNRWRLPQTLLSDCLGSTQALKSLYPIDVSYHKTMINTLTADDTKYSLRQDAGVLCPPRTSRVPSGRSYFTPAAADMPHTSAFNHGTPVGAVIARTASEKSKFKYSKPASLYACNPKTMILSQPMEIFYYHSKRPQVYHDPDVVLECLGLDWELHHPYLNNSQTLCQLLKRVESPKLSKQYKSAMSEKLDQFISRSDAYSNEYREIAEKLSVINGEGKPDNEVHCTKQDNGLRIIKLKVGDNLITRRALAIALGHLYRETTEITNHDLASVMAAARLLKFKRLVKDCVSLMMKTISPASVSKFYAAAHKCKQDSVTTACRRWLELNLIPQLSAQLHLRDMPLELLEKVLKSNRLFTYNDYWVYRTAAYWVFLQLNPLVQLMPSYSTMLTYFSSLGKSTALLEREEGRNFTRLFSTVRLHGITNRNDMQDIQTMNIIPQSWIVKVLSEHYNSLHNGGDMPLTSNFAACSVRRGFIIDEEPGYHSELLSLHGFHLELKAIRREDTYSFYIKRVRPTDPLLSLKRCERITISMRQNREVHYSIRAQWFDKSQQNQSAYTGTLIENFPFGKKTSTSKVLNLSNICPPIFVTFSILFPPS